jgi:hypothetical protein
VVNRALLAAVLLVLQGCASTSLQVEVEHVSHPTDGWPFGSRYEEDGLTQASVLAGWRFGRTYIDAGVGANLRGRNGGGFYGSPITGTVRAGYVLREGK